MRLVALTLPPVLIAGLVAAPASAHQPPRIYHVGGALNVRDIGGYTAAKGKKVRYGLVVRAASLSKVTPEGIKALRKLGIKTAVDFRSASERDTDGADRLPDGVKR